MFAVLKSKTKGFTLVELIVTVSIVVLLAGVAVPIFIGLTDKAKQGAEIAGATEIANVINLYNNMSPDDKLSQADVDGWASSDDMKASGLNEMAPILEPMDFTKARDRVSVSPKGVATVDTAFN